MDQADWANALWAADPYAQRMQEVLRRICRPDYPAGMILWLEQAHADLYLELTERLPDEIHRLWSTHAPLEEFQRVADEWLAAHRRACSLFRNDGGQS